MYLPPLSHGDLRVGFGEKSFVVNAKLLRAGLRERLRPLLKEVIGKMTSWALGLAKPTKGGHSI
jgi:hypothetical protein